MTWRLFVLPNARLFPFQTSMIIVPLRNACLRFTREICTHAIICSVGSILALWLIASTSLLPIGIAIYATLDKRIGTILMITGGVCLFVTIAYGVSLKFFEYYREEQVKEARRLRQVVPTVAPVAVQVPAVAPVAPVVVAVAPPPAENGN